MECCDITRNFLANRKGKKLAVLIEGGGFTPATGKLVDFDEAALVLEMPDGMKWLIDLDYVIKVAEVSEGE